MAKVPRKRSTFKLTASERAPLNEPFDRIRDPEAGLAQLAKRSERDTPEQRRIRLFWEFQFSQWRAWRAGDVLAVARAVICCSHLERPPPRWLRGAILELCERRMSDAEKRSYSDLQRHILRWEAVELVRGRRPLNPRNNKKKVRGDAVWEAAAKMLKNTGASGSAETMRKSYKLIRRAGGDRVSLPSYLNAVEERDRRRKKPG